MDSFYLTKTLWSPGKSPLKSVYIPSNKIVSSFRESKHYSYLKSNIYRAFIISSSGRHREILTTARDETLYDVL